MQAQLAEERERSTALEADQKEARETARKQQTAARREAEHLRERLAAAEAAADVSARKTSDLVAQLQVLLLLCLSFCRDSTWSRHCTPHAMRMPCDQGAHTISCAHASW